LHPNVREPRVDAEGTQRGAVGEGLFERREQLQHGLGPSDRQSAVGPEAGDRGAAGSDDPIGFLCGEIGSEGVTAAAHHDETAATALEHPEPMIAMTENLRGRR
jgi:hypothetical protein